MEGHKPGRHTPPSPPCLASGKLALSEPQWAPLPDAKLAGAIHSIARSINKHRTLDGAWEVWPCTSSVERDSPGLKDGLAFARQGKAF